MATSSVGMERLIFHPVKTASAYLYFFARYLSSRSKFGKLLYKQPSFKKGDTKKKENISAHFNTQIQNLSSIFDWKA